MPPSPDLTLIGGSYSGGGCRAQGELRLQASGGGLSLGREKACKQQRRGNREGCRASRAGCRVTKLARALPQGHDSVEAAQGPGVWRLEGPP